MGVGNHHLAAKVNVTKSSLDQMSDSDLEQTAERIGNLANDNITVLKTDYGVLGTDVTALDTARTTFASIKTSPREAAACTQSADRVPGAVDRKCAQHFPKRDRQDGHQISQNECGFLQWLFRRARDRQSRSHSRRPQAATSALAVRGTAHFKVRRKNVRLLLRTFV